MKRVVVIDDSEVTLQTIKSALADINCEVTTMTEPNCVGFTDEVPDLVLVDVNMPLAFGDDVARFLRDAWQITAPIYLCSSIDEGELAQRAREAGVEGYICKSWGLEKFCNSIRGILGMELSPASPGITGGLESTEVPAAPVESSETIFNRFSRRCDKRCREILTLLDADCVHKTSDADLLYEIGLRFHDWTGEARMLGFDPLATLAGDLLEVTNRWRHAFDQPQQAEKLRGWTTGLTRFSQHIALSPPRSEILLQMQEVQLELRAELGDDASEQVLSPSLAANGETQRRRIMVFDDSPIIGETIALGLEARGHQVRYVGNTEAFWAQVVDYDPEILFLDINMPEIKGDEVCRQLREGAETKHLKVVFLSSLVDEELAVLARRAQADGFLSKRHGMDKLATYLDELLMEIVF